MCVSAVVKSTASGPNGAGKSTAIRVLLGLMRADGGQAQVLDGDPWQDAVRVHRRLAYVPDEVQLWPNLSGGEVIDIIAGLCGTFDKQRRAELIEAFQFDPRKKFRTYSRGNRQKAVIIAALLSDVELYIMDEPTSGLDPLMEEVFQDYIRQLREAGKTVLFSSHVLAEVEKLCDRVTIIKDGRTVETGSLDELRHLTRTHVTVSLRQELGDWSQHAGITDFSRSGSIYSFSVTSEYVEAVMRELAEYGITSITATPLTLGELFMRYYQTDSQLSEE